MKKLWLILGFSLGPVFLHGCGSGAPPPPVAAQLKMTSSLVTSAGTAVQVTVTAVGANGAVASKYTGTVHFTSGDSQAVLPADSTLTSGSKTFSVTLKTAGNQSVSVADTVNASIAGSSSITVNPGPAMQFTVSGPSATTAGMAANISVGAQDGYGNGATGYTGMVKFSSSDAQAVLPGNAPLSGGTGNFSVTFKTLGSQTVSAADTVTASLKGSSSPINVVSNAPTHLSLNGIPGSVTTRQSFNFTLNALDAANNVSVGYNGTVQFSSSDAQAMLPAKTALTAGASSSVTATFENAGSGSQTITATGALATSLSGTATVSVSAAKTLSVSGSGGPPSGTVGVIYDPHTVFVCGPFPPNCFVAHVNGFPLSATGGVAPYQWTWAAATGSSLPPGLALHHPCVQYPRYAVSACIAGTPTQPGTYNVVVTVSDSGDPSAQASATYAITINNPPPPSVNSTSPSPAVENQPYSFTFTASGYAPLTWSESGTLPSGLMLNAGSGVLSGTPTQTGSFPISVTATDQFNQSSQAQNFTLVVSAHGFVADGNMTAARSLHTATLLSGGKVLISGGIGSGAVLLGSAELYDPNASTFTATGNMQSPRAQHTATRLNDGRVLMAGGVSSSPSQALATAELFDAAGGTSTATGSMTAARYAHTATLLGNGKVLVTGGSDATGTALASAELFDPSTGTFSSTGSMQTARKGHTATLLASGKVLVAGGIDDKSTDLGTAELYDPTAGTFSNVVGMMAVPRAYHTAALFTSGPDAGKVLLVGGVDGTLAARNTAELFDPTAQSFTPTTNMTTAHAYHTATLLPNGTLLVAGGTDATGNTTSVAELFDPSTGNFAATGSLVTAREQHTATLLPGGQVLVTGGSESSATGPLSTAEAYK
jgi:hypothetical protein